MPQGDGTGPRGEGPKTGRGAGGTGRGMGRGGGQGRRDGSGKGLSTFCICPDCGEKTPHQRGTPCFEQQCPKCGKAMIRDGMV